jgi:hypothetical protein
VPSSPPSSSTLPRSFGAVLTAARPLAELGGKRAFKALGEAANGLQAEPEQDRCACPATARLRVFLRFTHVQDTVRGRLTINRRLAAALAGKGGSYVWAVYGVYTGCYTAYIRRIIRIYGVSYVWAVYS